MKILKAFGLVIGLALLFIAGAVAIPVAAQNVVCYQSQGGASWVASSGCTWNVQSGATLQVDSGSTFTVNQTTLAAQTAISVTASSIITPTGEYQPLTSAGAVTATMSSGCTTGRKVHLVNSVNQTITISETATAAIAGNYAMGQYDSLTMLCDGTEWVELARSNN